jgi:large subunit ribosomal protein L22
MEVKAKSRFIRISPRKVRKVVPLVKGKEVILALNILKFLPQKGAKILEKVLKSAIANAEHNYNLDKGNLKVKNILVDQGPSLKRYLPRAMGRATPIKKRTSHITVIVDEIEEKEKKERR